MKKLLILLAALVAAIPLEAATNDVVIEQVSSTGARVRRNLAATGTVTSMGDLADELGVGSNGGPTLIAGQVRLTSANTVTITEASPDTGTISVTDSLNIATIDEATTLSPSAAGTANDYIKLRLINSDSSARAVTVDTGTDFAITVPATSTIEVGLRSDGSGWLLAGGPSGILDLNADTTPDAANVFETVNPTTGASTKSSVNELNKVVTKFVTGAYTVGTTDARELFGGVLYVTSAATVTIPAYAVGYNFTVITVGNIAVSIDPNASDLLMLEGVALSDGDKITNTSTSGDMAVITDYNSTGFYAATNGWTDTN